MQPVVMHILTLEEGDIEGAALEEPLESKTIPQLAMGSVMSVMRTKMNGSQA